MKVSLEADTAIGISVARFSKTKRILAIAGLERKPTLLAVNLIAGAGLVAKSFEAAVDADRIVVGLLPPIHIRNAHCPFALAKSAHHAALTRSESMHPEPMKFIIVRTCQISRIEKADSDRRMARWPRGVLLQLAFAAENTLLLQKADKLEAYPTIKATGPRAASPA